ncbi:hypothetical protein [Halomonas sp. LBP4]|uniref:hypothetical protein n=1 Tax=Halomonas sp. LBP4 TaxID=2044917 RepID=UPI0011B616CA|nr:hypothetical protein [Halomonas sp. LBP4]
MKKILLISIAALLLTACSPVNGEPPAHYLERAGAALVEARGDTQQLEEVLTIYEEGQEQHPNDPALPNSRAQLLAASAGMRKPRTTWMSCRKGNYTRKEC